MKQLDSGIKSRDLLASWILHNNSLSLKFENFVTKMQMISLATEYSKSLQTYMPYCKYFVYYIKPFTEKTFQQTTVL